jgi:integrase/recombinase XerD
MSEIAVRGIVLPGIPSASDPVAQLTAAWLMSQRTRNTMLAYRCDVVGIGTTGKPASMKVAAWLPWLEENGILPLAARRGHVDTYSRLLDISGSAPATILRKISAVSSWYTYMVREEATDKNPARWATRPAIDQHSSNTVGLSQEEAQLLIAAADKETLRTAAIIRALLFGGWRISLIMNAVLSDLGRDRGHRTIRVTLKGGKVIKAPLSAPVSDALDAWLGSRGPAASTDLIFPTSSGHRMDHPYLWRLVRSVARSAGIPSWHELSPHSLRHTFATLSFDFGIPLADVQDAMGHTDPRTTRRYDRARHRLDRHPTYVLAERLTGSSGAPRE